MFFTEDPVVISQSLEHEVDNAVSYGVGAVALVILLVLLGGLLAFGKGREHS